MSLFPLTRDARAEPTMREGLAHSHAEQCWGNLGEVAEWLKAPLC